MNFPVPDFIPVPSSKAMFTVSIVLLIVGICFVSLGTVFLFLYKRKQKKVTIPWICICVGILLMANHGIQLLFNY